MPPRARGRARGPRRPRGRRHAGARRQARRPAGALLRRPGGHQRGRPGEAAREDHPHRGLRRRALPRRRGGRRAGGRPRADPRRDRPRRRLRHRLARLPRAAADQPPRAARRGDRAGERDRVQLPGRRRRPAARRHVAAARPGPLLPRRRRARLRAGRGAGDGGGARAVRVQPADRGRGQGDHRRVRDDRAAPARREEAGRAAREQDRRHPRPLPALRGRHGARDRPARPCSTTSGRSSRCTTRACRRPTTRSSAGS